VEQVGCHPDVIGTGIGKRYERQFSGTDVNILTEDDISKRNGLLLNHWRTILTRQRRESQKN
jgi:hypothetical protein